MIALALKLALLTPVAEASSCLDYHPTQLTGELVRETFPGPPDYETLDPDTAETFFLLKLAKPACVSAEGAQSEIDVAVDAVDTVQLIFADGKAYDELRPALGKSVRCDGSLMGQITAHHHTPVLLVVEHCEAL